MASKHLTLKQRNNFKRIMAQLERTRSDKNILKIIVQAQAFLDECHIGWDALQLYLPSNYVFKNQRKASVKVATALMPNGAGQPLGRDGRMLLKAAVVKHPDWPVVRETLGVDMSHVSVADLIAIAQLLGLDDRFIGLFRDKETGAMTGTNEHTIKDLEEILAEKNGIDNPSE